MSNWISHEMWFRNPEKENLFLKLKEDGFIQDVATLDGGTRHELNIGKMSSEWLAEEEKIYLKWCQDHDREPDQEQITKLGTCPIHQKEKGIALFFNYACRDDILSVISKQYPNDEFQCEIRGEIGRSYISGYVKNGSTITNDGKPYKGYLIVNDSSIKKDRNGKYYASIPIKKSNEEQTEFIRFYFQEENRVNASDLGKDITNDGIKSAILFSEPNPVISILKQNGEWDEMHLNEVFDYQLKAKREFAMEKAKVEFDVRAKDLSVRVHNRWNHQVNCYGVITMTVPSEISENGIASFTVNELHDQSDRGARFYFREEMARIDYEFPDTLEFYSVRDFDKTVQVMKNGEPDRITIPMSQVKTLYQDHLREMEQRQRNMENEEEADRDRY